MPTLSIYAYGLFAVVFLVLYSLMRPRSGVADRDLRHTPVSFGVMLIGLLFIVFMQARSPISSDLDRWAGYATDIFLAGYLIRLYARLHARLSAPAGT